MYFEILFFSLLSIAISMIYLFIKKKKFDFNSYHIKIRGYKVLILAAVIKITAEFLFKKYTDVNLLRILSNTWIIYLALLYVSFLNIKKSYMILLFAGTLFNFLAIGANGFKMPVYVSELLADAESKRILLASGKDLVHSLLTEESRLKFLCDIITLHPPYPFAKTISLGDVFLLSGIFAFFQDLFYQISYSKH